MRIISLGLGLIQEHLTGSVKFGLTLIWVGFLGVRFEVEGRGRAGGKTTPLSKTRENYARNFKFGTYTHTHTLKCSFRKLPFSTKALLIC